MLNRMEEVKSRQEIVQMIAEANQKLVRMLEDMRSDADQRILSKIELLCAEYRAVGFFEGQLHLLDFISDAGRLTSNVQHETKQDHPAQPEKKDGTTSHGSNRRYF